MCPGILPPFGAGKMIREAIATIIEVKLFLAEMISEGGSFSTHIRWKHLLFS